MLARVLLMSHRDLESLPTGKTRCKTQLIAHMLVMLPERYVVPLKADPRKSKTTAVNPRFPNWILPENNMFTAVAPATHGANLCASSVMAEMKFL